MSKKHKEEVFKKPELLM